MALCIAAQHCTRQEVEFLATNKSTVVLRGDPEAF